MSIAFIPITAKSNLYNEEIVNTKWNSFLTNLSKNIETVSNIKINQNDFNSLVENALLKHYAISSSTSIKNTNSSNSLNSKEKKDEKDNKEEDNNEEDDKEEEVKVEKKVEKIKESKSKKEVKKVKEEKPRCSQILKNNEQCKGKSVKNSQFCTRHTPKEENNEDSD